MSSDLPGQPAYFSLVNSLGSDIVDHNKKIDTKKLKAMRYELPDSRKIINSAINVPLAKLVARIVWDCFWSGKHTFAVVKYSFLLDSDLLWWMCYPIVHLEVINEKTWISRIKDKENCTPQVAKQLSEMSKQGDILKDWAEIHIDNSDDKKKLSSVFGENFLPYITV